MTKFKDLSIPAKIFIVIWYPFWWIKKFWKDFSRTVSGG